MLALVLPACGEGASGVATIGAPRIHGPLRTEGMTILDARGRPVRFMGIQLGGMAPGTGLPLSVDAGPNGCRGWAAPGEDAYRNIAVWGFNMVRVPISWANLEPEPPARGPGGKLVHRYNQPYLQAFDGIVERATGRGLAVVVEMAQNHWSPAFTDLPTRRGPEKCRGIGMPAWLYPDPGATTIPQAKLDFFANRRNVQQGLVDAWRFIADRYASNPMVVAFDMFNEPYTNGAFPASRLRLDALYRRIGEAIREVNPRALLSFQDIIPRDGRPVDFGLRRRPPFPGVVYQFHLYVPNWRPEGLRLAELFLDRARRWRVPLWIGEFDAFGYASPRGATGDWEGDLEEMMSFCKEHGIGWTEFTYAPRWVFAPGTTQPRPGLLEGLAEGV